MHRDEGTRHGKAVCVHVTPKLNVLYIAVTVCISYKLRKVRDNNDGRFERPGMNFGHTRENQLVPRPRRSVLSLDGKNKK